MEEAAERLTACYRRAGWTVTAAIELLGIALNFGPRPVHEAIARLEALTAADAGDRAVGANSAIWLGCLEAMRENFDLARAHVEGARAAFRDLGLMYGVVDGYGRALGTIELLAGSPVAAERSLRDACSFLQELHDGPVLATRAAELAAALYEQGRYDEAAEWLGIASENAGDDDLDAVLTRQPVEARLRARQGDAEGAERVARANVGLAERTDALNRHADALLALAEVLDLAGSPDEGHECLQQALALYERKGNLAAARLSTRRLPAPSVQL
jgi:tetratricopeptide (TPR) repeat protein